MINNFNPSVTLQIRHAILPFLKMSKYSHNAGSWRQQVAELRFKIGQSRSRLMHALFLQLLFLYDLIYLLRNYRCNYHYFNINILFWNFLNLIFQLQFAFNIFYISCRCTTYQLDNLYNLQSNPSDNSNMYLAPYTVITLSPMTIL